MEKLVSVIIPTYHGERFIRRAIETVIHQDYSNIEIIVVDDNGLNTKEQNKTKKIVKGMGEQIRYIVHEKNINGAAARNTGIKESLGEYICFLDDDDLMLPDRISASVNVLEKDRRYEAVFVDVVCTDEYLTPTKMIQVRKRGNCYKCIMLDNMFFGTGSNIFLSRRAIEATGMFDEKFVRYQDLEYMLRFYRNFQSTYIPEVLLVKSKNGTNNIPNYENLKMAEKLYIEKFKNEIAEMNDVERHAFYAIRREQLRFSQNMDPLKRRRTFKEKTEYFIYGYMPRTSFFPTANRLRKIIGSRKISRLLDQHILQFLKTYR